MSDYVLGVHVEDDLNDIWDYIAEDSPAAASRLIERFFKGFETIARHPSIGHKREDLTQFPVRFWPVGNYLVIYRLKDDLVEIVAVVHGKRDIPAFLRRRSP